LKIAFDVDGVITEMPELFAVLTMSLRKAGHSVIILTDFDEHFRSYREEELAKYGIEYDELIITGDKESYCQAQGIHFAFDDDPDYYLKSEALRLIAFRIPPRS
jgi:uncharacterized HAD superfamily protein